MNTLIELGTNYGSTIEIAVWSIVAAGVVAITIFATKEA